MALPQRTTCPSSWQRGTHLPTMQRAPLRVSQCLRHEKLRSTSRGTSSTSGTGSGGASPSEGSRTARSTPRAPGAMPPRPTTELTVSAASVSEALESLWDDAAASPAARALRAATDPASITSTSGKTSTTGTPATTSTRSGAAAATAAAPAANVEGTVGWRRRWTMVLLCFVAFMLCNMDRVNMSVAILPMSQQYQWSPQTMGMVQSSFFWGYLCTQILGGVWAAKWGGKAVLGFGVAWWSLATALTPFAASLGLPALMAARAMMGLGEGVAMPAMNQLLSRWVPSTERSRSLALVYSGMFLGSMTGLTLSPQIINAFGWPSVFVSFGSLGAVWMALWLTRAASSPSSDPLCSPAERDYIAANTMGRTGTLDLHHGGGSAHSSSSSSAVSVSGNGAAAAAVASTSSSAATQAEDANIDIPWAKLLSKKEVWAIILCHFCHNWGTFILLTWMPSYYSQALGLDLASSGMLSCLPWATMAVMANIGGFVADWAVAKGATITTVRKVMQTIGFLGPAFFLGQLSHVSTAVGAVICMMGAQGCDAFSQSGLYSNHQDIAPRYAGVLLGLSNTAGVLAGVLGSLVTGYILQHGTWDQVWQVAIALYLVGTVIWNTWSTGEKVID